MTTTKTATYKGRTYNLLYLGMTKFGRRAKLSFLDGSKEFWVDANLVRECGAAVATSRSHGSRLDEDDRCEVCDRNKWTCGHCVGW